MQQYCPEAIDFSNVESRIKEGYRFIDHATNDAEGLTVDASNLVDGGTLSICMLIEWRRAAQRKNCRLCFASIPARVKKLIAVYQVDKIIYEGECMPIEVPTDS